MNENNNQKTPFKVTLLGVRGSVPVSGQKFMKYGGSTACIMITYGSRKIFIDGGSGILDSGEVKEDTAVLLTHSHMDHLMGLPLWKPLFSPEKVDIYSTVKDGRGPEDMLNALMKEPLWPVNIGAFHNTEFHRLDMSGADEWGIASGVLRLGNLVVDAMEGDHPGGVTCFRIREDLSGDSIPGPQKAGAFRAGRSVCIVTDCEFDEHTMEKYIRFIKDTNLLLVDGQYTEEEFFRKQGWGHPSASLAAKLGARGNAGKTVIIHHDVSRTDENMEFIIKPEAAGAELGAQNAEYEIQERINIMSKENMNVERLLNIGIDLSKERDSRAILTRILDAAMDFTHCDGGTIYTKDGDCLTFRLMITKSQNIRKGMDGEEIDLPPVPASRQNVCYCAVLDGEVFVVDNVYDDERFDFEGPKRYDDMTGYHTRSMLVVPMENDRGENIGVLQLINATDDSGKVTEFAPEDIIVIQSLASFAAIRLTTLNYNEELHRTFDSFVEVMSTAIDARTPYDANHSRNMARYCGKFLDYLEKIDSPLKMNREHRREMLMTVWLHDVGKLTAPLDVMDKESRIGSELGAIRTRFRIIRLLNEKFHARGQRTDDEYNAVIARLKDAEDLILKVNSAGYLDDELLEQVNELGKLTFTDEEGGEEAWFTDYEMECLRIRTGTLTDTEREIMQSHVKMTAKLLNTMYFSHDLSNVAKWAGMHHEFIDGTGYPNHMKEDEIPYQVRMLTLIDIFEALTARDRPYKKGMSAEQALSILHDMADKGMLDAELLQLLEDSRVWED